MMNIVKKAALIFIVLAISIVLSGVWNLTRKKTVHSPEKAEESGTMQDYVAEGIVLMEEGRPESAISSFTKAIEADQENAAAYNNRGGAYASLAKYESALADYDKAISLNPGLAEAYANRGMALGFLNRFEEAAESATKAIGLAPDYAKAYTVRGRALTAMSRLDEAIVDFDKVIALDLRDSKPYLIADAYFFKGFIFEIKKDYSSAIEHYVLYRDFLESLPDGRDNPLIENANKKIESLKEKAK